jgi:hypothetical protein
MKLQGRVRDLCREFQDIFSDKLNSEPAKVPPLTIKVDSEKWTHNRNRGPPRFLTRDKDKDLRTQIETLLELGVIEESSAGEYSQVHLVKKPDGSWRLCIDFVNLNDATLSVESWPLQNISHMLQRIGSRRPRLYAKMDLTSGYFQMLLDSASRLYTAFITFMGLFQWVRVPMGLKGAPSYFQRMMATVVLAGLIYTQCEAYLDDVLVFGETEDEYIDNLRSVFERFRKFGITLNPKKCEFGLEEVEFVGHVLGADGISFSKEKTEKVLDFPVPQTMKQLRAFIGLVNYFRDHVRDLSTMVRPLNAMVTPYKPGVKLVWTEEATEAFKKVQEKVAACPKLFYVDTSLPIVVQTDASDYGIGGYIFQKSGNKELPIIFISKALNTTQLNWSTIEKEAYAIYYTLKKFDYLLRDVEFLLQTDHKNLTYLRTAASAKVRRWKMELQEYSFQLQHIAGEQNVVADGFSRLCEHRMQSLRSEEPEGTAMRKESVMTLANPTERTEEQKNVKKNPRHLHLP